MAEDDDSFTVTAADRAMGVMALDLARHQMVDRKLAKEVRYVGIAKTVAAYLEAAPNRKEAIFQAAKAWRVTKRTVENALSWRVTETK